MFPEGKLRDWFKDSWAVVVFLMNAVTAIVDFIVHWSANYVPTVFAAAFLSYFFFLIAAIYGVYATKGTVTFPYRQGPRFSDRIRRKCRYAVLGLAIIPLAFLVYSFLPTDRSKIVVAVADLYGPDEKRYQVTQDLFFQLHQSFDKYRDDAKIVALHQTIGEDEDKGKLRSLAKKSLTDILLWGRYEFETGVNQVVMHVETFAPQKRLSFEKLDPYIKRGSPKSHPFEVRDDATQGTTALTLFLSGVIFYEAENYPKAISLLNTSLQTGNWPERLLNKSYVYYYRGNCHLFSNEINEAIKDYDTALESNPKHEGAYVNRGYAYDYLGEAQGNQAYTHKAVDDYTLAIQLDPTDKVAYNNLGAVYSALGNQQEAMNYYSRANQIDSSYCDPYYNSGLAHGALAESNDDLYEIEFRRAIDAYTQAIECDRNFSDAFTNRAHAYNALKQYDNAILDCTEAVRINAADSFAYFNRGNAYSDKGDYPTAIADYDRAIALNPQDKEFFENRGYAYEQEGHLSEALEDYSEVVRIDDQYADGFYDLGNIKLALAELNPNPSQSEFEMAIEAYTRAINLNPSFAEAYNNRGDCLEALNHRQEAIADYQKARRYATDAETIEDVKEKLRKLGVNPR